MASDWLKMKLSLPTSGKIIAIARAMGVRRSEALGCCLTFWAWAHEQTTDGIIPGVAPSDVDDLVGRKGFADALQLPAVGWLEAGPGGVTIPRWDEHNSEGAKARAEAAVRMSRSRNVAQNAQQKRNTGATNMEQTRNETGTNPQPEKRREEKRRTTTPLPPPPGEESGGSVGGGGGASEHWRAEAEARMVEIGLHRGKAREFANHPALKPDELAETWKSVVNDAKVKSRVGVFVRRMQDLLGITQTAGGAA